MSNIPELNDSPYPCIDDLHIGLDGVVKQLKKINCSKAGGPDEIPARFLHDYADDIAPVLHFIMQQSFNTGMLPNDWKKALVTGIFKKGKKSSPENYRPVSLTCIACKIMEHIVLSHMAKHLARHNIIINHQHGFRERLSCETQLIEALHDWSGSLNRSKQMDVLMLDFSKAFDTVPHHRLSIKLQHYGIRGRTIQWINDFLSDRVQSVVVNGAHSS
jgi:hypothetical protein